MYPESRSDGNWRNQIPEGIFVTSTTTDDFLETWLDEGIGFRSCSTSRSQPTQPNPNPIYRTGRPVVTEQTSRSSAQEIDTRFSLDCKNTTLFVERLEKDKDTDKDVDADHDRTGRPVVSGQPTGSSTQVEEVDIDFRVSGLPHAVAKQAENSRVRELVKKIESHFIDKIFKPIYNKVMPTTHSVKNQTRWFRTWAMWSYVSYARQFLKCNAQNAFFTGIKASFIALVDISWERIDSAEISSDGHWIFSQSPTMSFRRGDLMAIVMGRLKNKDNTKLPIIWERDASKDFLKEFTIVSRTIQHFVNRFSALIELKKYASRWTKDAQKDVTYRMSQDEYFRYKKNWWISLNTCGKNKPMKLRSDFNEALTKLHRLHRESEEERLAAIPSWQYQK